MTIVILKFHFYVNKRYKFRNFSLISFFLCDVINVFFVKTN